MRIPLEPNDHTLMIVPLWDEEEGGIVRASFGLSILSAVFETLDEARTFIKKLIRYTRVLEQLLKLDVYGVDNEIFLNKVLA